ncbi:MAG TPA: 50S ribosomal protein L3 [Candidatus Dojkabacteria bacterium]|nr:50S ribosomal protein L3 [Candidatus Dojkabacteria bacterium]
MKTIIGLKKNMSQIFKEDGNVVPVTFVDVADIVVAHKKTVEKDGYKATVIGLGKKKNPSKAEVGKFKELGFVPMYAVEVELEEELNVGDKVNVSMFEAIKKVNVTGITKGKGFQGVVKRWGFKGGPRTHGQSDRQRHPGSIGMRTTPGRVFKGKKMGGRMGGDTKTVKNLRVVEIDQEHGLIALKGAVPGNKDSLVIIESQS